MSLLVHPEVEPIFFLLMVGTTNKRKDVTLQTAASPQTLCLWRIPCVPSRVDCIPSNQTELVGRLLFRLWSTVCHCTSPFQRWGACCSVHMIHSYYPSNPIGTQTKMNAGRIVVADPTTRTEMVENRTSPRKEAL